MNITESNCRLTAGISGKVIKQHSNTDIPEYYWKSPNIWAIIWNEYKKMKKVILKFFNNTIIW